MTPFFSIIIPTYNRAHILEKAIDSVMSQHFKKWEMIIIDDGSTDDTKKIVSKYNDERLKYFFRQHAERSAARNFGIGNSQGTYICFLDSDDYFLPDRLEKLYEEIKKRNSPVALLYTGICFEHNGSINKREELPNNYKSIRDYIVINVIGSPQVCIHRNILSEHHFNEKINISEDTELWMRIIDAHYPILFLDHYNVVASEDHGRSINENENNPYGRMLEVMKFIFSKGHPGSKVSPGLKKMIISNAYYGIAKHYIFKCNKAQAYVYLLRSVIVNPTNQQSKHKIFLLYKMMFMKKSKLFQLKELMG
jgi:glycosyltransferase involved in cell wall biosynthesis